MMPFILSLQQRSVEPEPEPEPEPVQLELAEMDGYIEFTGAQTLMADASSNSSSERLYAPRIIYHNGRSYFAYASHQDAPPYGQVRLLTFDGQRGFDKPRVAGTTLPRFSAGAGVPPAPPTGDTHTVPSIFVSPDPDDGLIEKIQILQEHTHLSPFDRYQQDADYSTTTLQDTIGINLAYAHPLTKPDGHPIIWCRGGDIAGSSNHLYSIYVVDSSNYAKGLASATPRRITQKEGTGLWHYAGIPFGYYRVGNKFFLLISRRTGTQDAGTYTDVRWNRFYLVTTEDFITFTNYPGTFSHDTSVDGLLTGAILETNFMYHTMDDPNYQGRVPVAGISSEGFFCDINGAANEDGSYVFIYYDGSGTLIKKAVSIPDIETRATSAQPGSFAHMMVYSQTDIRVIVYRTVGSYTRPYWYQTTNLGDSWTNLGDLAAGIENTTLRAMLHNDIFQIPKNKNFPVWFTQSDTVTTLTKKVWAKVWAWGSIQPIPSPAIVAATDLNYNSLGLFHYKANASNLVLSGANVTTMTDLFGLRNATGVNNPQFVTDHITTNGTNQYFTIPATGIASLARMTFSVVAKLVSGQTSVFLSISDTSSTNEYYNFTLTSAGAISVRQNNPTAVIAPGQDLIADSNYHILTFVLTDKTAYLYVDNSLQYITPDATTEDNYALFGKGPGHITTVNAVRIGMRDSSSGDAFYQVDFKEMVGYGAALPIAALDSINKKLADDHGITLQSHYKIPA